MGKERFIEPVGRGLKAAKDLIREKPHVVGYVINVPIAASGLVVGVAAENIFLTSISAASLAITTQRITTSNLVRYSNERESAKTSDTGNQRA